MLFMPWAHNVAAWESPRDKIRTVIATPPTVVCIVSQPPTGGREPSQPQGKPGNDDKMRASTRNISLRSFLTMTSDNLIQETPKGCGDWITTIMGGQDDLVPRLGSRFGRPWKLGRCIGNDKRPSTPGSSQRQAMGPLTGRGSAGLMPNRGKEGRRWPMSSGFMSACQ